MDILCAEEEKLPFFEHMGHIIIGAVTTVTDKNSLFPGGSLMAVHQGGKGPVFILIVNRLDQCIGIDVLVRKR